MLAAAAFTGVAAHVLWGDAGAWVDVAPGCLALVGGSLAVVVVLQLCGPEPDAEWLPRALVVLALSGLVFTGLYPLLERNHGVVLLGLHLLAVAALSLYAATLTWRRGDPVGLWLLAGAVPLALTVAMALARVLGWIESSWVAEYALILALTVNMPLLFGALNSRSQERRSVELRRLASASQDPLTGLLKRGPFVARLQQAVARYQRRGEPAAVAVIELINHGWIQKSSGAEAAEEALLRTVIKLRRLVRDVDTTGRIGENRFGLILEGVAMRRPMNTVATRLVAAGLMEDPEAPRDTVLHFHVAAAVLTEYQAPAESLLDQLGGLLDGMSPRTRRPLRFLPGDGAPSGSGALDGADSSDEPPTHAIA
jgi:GGDEF domain-containing protein